MFKRKSKTLLHSPEDDADGLQCCICLDAVHDPASLSKLPCGHVYCANCYQEWMEHGGSSCPVCRRPLPTPDRAFAETRHDSKAEDQGEDEDDEKVQHQGEITVPVPEIVQESEKKHETKAEKRARKKAERKQRLSEKELRKEAVKREKALAKLEKEKLKAEKKRKRKAQKAVKKEAHNALRRRDKYMLPNIIGSVILIIIGLAILAEIILILSLIFA